MKLKSDRETSSFQTFSMSIATLERINELLKELHNTWIDGDILKIQRLLFSLYKELYPFLDKKERIWGDKKTEIIWESLTFDEESQNFSYSDGLSRDLNQLDFWLRDKLHEKGLLISNSAQ